MRAQFSPSFGNVLHVLSYFKFRLSSGSRTHLKFIENGVFRKNAIVSAPISFLVGQ